MTSHIIKSPREYCASGTAEFHCKKDVIRSVSCSLSPSTFQKYLSQFGLILRPTVPVWQYTWSRQFHPGYHPTGLISKYPFPNNSNPSPATAAYWPSICHMTSSEPITAARLTGQPRSSKTIGRWAVPFEKIEITGIMVVVQVNLPGLHLPGHQAFGFPWLWEPVALSP